MGDQDEKSLCNRGSPSEHSMKNIHKEVTDRFRGKK